MNLSTQQLSAILSSGISPPELFKLLSEYEDDVCLLLTPDGVAGDQDLPGLFYSSFFLCHLLIGEIPAARALTLRIPQGLLEKDLALQNCLNLLNALWQSKHDQVYKVLRDLPWPDPMTDLVRRYEEFFQNKTLQEVSRAYEAIRPQTAARYLGFDRNAADQSDPAIIQRFINCGWRWDDDTKLLYPKPIMTAPFMDVRPRKALSQTTTLIGSYGS